LRDTSGPLVEVGGPTTRGYISLDRVKLENGLIVLDVEQGMDGVDVVGDIRDFPFAGRSLGGIVMSALTRIPEEIAKSPDRKMDVHLGNFAPHLMEEIGHRATLLMSERLEDYSGWNDPQIMNYSLRLAMLRESRRTIEPGGMLLVNTIGGDEIRLAGDLGFELVDTSVKDVSRSITDYNDGEFVFRLADMGTPAGLLIESANN